MVGAIWKERTEQHQHIGSIHAESGSSITIQQSVSTPAPAAPGPIEDPPLINPIRPWIERLLSGLPLRSADAVQRFLLHYLDTDDAPKSFVGRDATLDRLQRWPAAARAHDTNCWLLPLVEASRRWYVV